MTVLNENSYFNLGLEKGYLCYAHSHWSQEILQTFTTILNENPYFTLDRKKGYLRYAPAYCSHVQQI